jgi:nitroreductase
LIHPLTTAWLLAIDYLILISLIAFIGGREISLWPPRIGGKPTNPQINKITNENSTNVFDVIKLRKSVRWFIDKPIEEEKINLILESARLAPSASNRQEWRFVIVNDRDLLDRIARASCIYSFIKNFPNIIVACADTDLHVMKCGQLSYPIDVAIALDHISLSAAALGLGTCWIGMFHEEKIIEIIGTPKGVRIVALMVLGYPKDPAAIEKKRHPLNYIIKYNHW